MAHPALVSLDTRDSVLAVNWLGHAAECSPSSSVKVNVGRAVSSHPNAYSWHAHGQLYLHFFFVDWQKNDAIFQATAKVVS